MPNLSFCEAFIALSYELMMGQTKWVMIAGRSVLRFVRCGSEGVIRLYVPCLDVYLLLPASLNSPLHK